MERDPAVASGLFGMSAENRSDSAAPVMRGGEHWLRWLVPVLVVAEIGLIWTGAVGGWSAFERGMAMVAPRMASRLLVTEIRLWVCLATWLARHHRREA